MFHYWLGKDNGCSSRMIMVTIYSKVNFNKRSVAEHNLYMDTTAGDTGLKRSTPDVHNKCKQGLTGRTLATSQTGFKDLHCRASAGNLQISVFIYTKPAKFSFHEKSPAGSTLEVVLKW